VCDVCIICPFGNATNLSETPVFVSLSSLRTKCEVAAESTTYKVVASSSLPLSSSSSVSGAQ
jgi:hypothetical protein